MNRLELLKLKPDVLNRLETSIINYQRFTHLVIRVVSVTARRVIVQAEQKDYYSGRFFTRKDVEDRVKEMFSGVLAPDQKLNIGVVYYNGADIDNMNAAEINRKMANLNLKAKHLTKHLGIDKTTISQILTGQKDLTKWHKAAFYYYFKHFELTELLNR